MPPASRVLMCPPTHFAVDYVINPWMDGHVDGVDPARATAQWRALREAVARHADVALVEPAPGLPDMPFTANAGLVRGNVFVPSRFRHAQRRGEEALFAAWFRAHGFEVRELPPGLDFEGAGDALFDRGAARLWVGHGHRSDAGAAGALAGLLGIEAIALHLVDPRFYHLDTCFCPLADGWLLYYPPAFDAEAQAAIAAKVPAARRIAVDEADALAFACNAVGLGRQVLLNAAGDALLAKLREAGFAAVQTPLDEFLKAGGSAKCLTLRLDESA